MSNSNDPKSILAKYRAKVLAQSDETAQSEAEKSKTAQNGQSNKDAQDGQQNATAQNSQTSEAAQGALPNQALSTRSGAAELNKKGASKQSALKNASALEKQKQQAVKMFDQLSQRSDDVNAKYFQKLAEIGNMKDYDPNSKKTKKALDKVIAEFAPQFAELENGFRDLDALLASIDNAQWVDG